MKVKNKMYCTSNRLWRRKHNFRFYDIVNEGNRRGYVSGLMGDGLVGVQFDRNQCQSEYFDFRELARPAMYYRGVTLEQQERRILQYLNLCDDCSWVCSVVYDLEPAKCRWRLPKLNSAIPRFELWSSRLCDLGLVREVCDSDRSENYVQITGSGKHLLRCPQ